jgi:hypothetical protein
MRLFKNINGNLFSDLFYLGVAVAIIVVGMILLMNISNKETKDNLQEVASIKEGYQTIQLARTFLQTPLEINGETKLISVWANEYFTIDNFSEKTIIRKAMTELADKTLAPHLRAGVYATDAVFTYYNLGNLKSSLTVASVSYYFISKHKQEGIIYSDISQEDIKIQLPVYVKGLQYNPSDKYIIFEIRTSDEIDTDTSFYIGI